MSYLRSTTSIISFDDDEFDFIKWVLESKLMQLRAGHGEKLDLQMDENTFTSTVISPDFELLKACFPGLIVSRWYVRVNVVAIVKGFAN